MSSGPGDRGCLPRVAWQGAGPGEARSSPATSRNREA